METPPRAWGRHPPHRPDSGPVGNTPTSVGKTPARQSAPRPSRKHPHERGEDVRPSLTTGTGLETPPRAWGRRRSMDFSTVLTGNTPTSVGKTWLLVVALTRYKKHPHERGEDSSPTGTPKCCGETPPRAWGRRKKIIKAARIRGNTPTSVGKTVPPTFVTAPPGKHPHERGEDATPV